MHQVAEFFAAEGVVAEVLDDGAAVGIGVRLPDLVIRKSGISLEQEGSDLIGPEQVHDFLVGQNRVCRRTAAAHEHDEKKCHCTDKARRQPLAMTSSDIGRSRMVQIRPRTKRMTTIRRIRPNPPVGA